MKIISTSFKYGRLTRFFYAFALLLATFNQLIAQNNTSNPEYSKYISSGDKNFNAKDYGFALLDYGKALRIVPGQAYPLQKIEQIRQLFEKDPSLEPALFENTILKGETLLKAKDYPTAKRHFEAALELDPSSTFARDKLADIRQLYSDPEDAFTYADAMAKGNSLLLAGQYDDAINWFNIAMAVNPQAKPPRDKILEAGRLKTEAKNRKEQYDRLIAGADKLLASGQRTEARAEYQKATDLMPQETYSKSKIREIDDFLNAKKTIQDNYDKAIEQADQFYINRDFVSAAAKYREALSYKPEARYPKEMLEKSGQGQAQLQTVKERYDATIAAADRLFAAGDLNAASDSYKTALAILPIEKYPKNKIAEIENILHERATRKEAYDIAILNGNQALEQDKPELALTHFKNALSLLPDEKYPAEKIAEINTLLVNRKKAEDNYRNQLALADQLLRDRKYQEALSGYRLASAIKPAEQYPKEKITEIEKILADQQLAEENYAKAFQRGNERFEAKEYMLALGSYNEALKYKPGDKPSQDQIDKINRILADEKTLQENFSRAIAAGDEAFAASRYTDALAAFNDALKLKPAEKYPAGKIAEINKILAENASRKESYNKAVAAADALFIEKKYTESREGYRNALVFMPDETYPKNRIDEINSILEGIKAKDESYAKLIKDADGQFQLMQYENALNAYQSALALKPAEKYPQDRISEINRILSDQKARNDAYDKALVDGDAFFAEAKYVEAITSYKSALEIKPDEKYPKQKIAEADKALADLKAKQDLYDKSIATGDKLFAAKNYEAALTSYQTAREAKPSEKYPPQKISEINTILDALKSRDESYAKAVADGDSYFGIKKYREALEPYERASTIKPEESYPPSQIDLIKKLLAEQKKLDDSYTALIATADKSFAAKDYQPALKGYTDASAMKPGEEYPKKQIAAIQSALAELKAKEEAYLKAIADADGLYKTKQLQKSLETYRKALDIKPEEAYPKERIKTIEAELKAIDDLYNMAIAEGDRKFQSKDYTAALNAYQKATETKPDEQYPKNQIEAINQALAREKEELDRMYASYISEGDNLFGSKDYPGARSAFTKASGIKPAEQYPKDKLKEIAAILLEQEKALKAAYEKAIADADKLYQQKIFDQAVDAYMKAEEIKPDETYPAEMIRKIRKYLNDHAIKDINTLAVSIGAGEEKKFSFSVIEPRLRKNNYILIHAKATGNSTPKVYLNYGRDSQKNGGVVIRNISSKESADFLIRLAGQDKWYREDNNWISIYTEGSSIEVSKVQIAAGDDL